MYLYIDNTLLYSLEVKKKPAHLVNFPESYLRNSVFHLIPHIHKLIFKQAKSESHKSSNTTA